MTSSLPEELKVKVKERLRDARFVAREMRSQAPHAEQAYGSPAGDLPPAIAEFGRKFADFSDTALQKLETVAIGFLSSDPQAHFGEARAYPLDRYTGPRQSAAQALFARDSYFAAKQVLRAKGISNPRVSEEMFAAAHRLAGKQWQTSRNDPGAASLEAIARDAAVLAQAIARSRPVLAPRYLDADAAGTPVNSLTYVAAAIGLATAVASYHRDVLSAQDAVYPGVCAAVDVRYAVLEKAMAEADRPGHLADAFADLIPHLP